MLKVSVAADLAEWVSEQATASDQTVDEYVNGVLGAVKASSVELSRLEQNVLDIIKAMAGAGGVAGAIAVVGRFASYPSTEVWSAIDNLKSRGLIEDAGGRAALRPL